jgi:hypothetical protein
VEGGCPQIFWANADDPDLEILKLSVEFVPPTLSGLDAGVGHPRLRSLHHQRQPVMERGRDRFASIP